MLRTLVQILRSGAHWRRSLGTRPQLRSVGCRTPAKSVYCRHRRGNAPPADIVKMVHPRLQAAWQFSPADSVSRDKASSRKKRALLAFRKGDMGAAPPDAVFTADQRAAESRTVGTAGAAMRVGKTLHIS